MGLILKAIPTLVVLGILGAAWFAVHRLDTSEEQHRERQTEVVSKESGVVTLPNGKLEAAEFRSEPVESQALQKMHIVPGRIRYDETQHIDVTSPIDGIVSDVFVKPGEQVSQNHLLAVISSPEIGQARAEIKKCAMQVELAEQQRDRELMLAKNLKELFVQLDRGQDIESIETDFANKSLGVFRQDLLSAYSSFVMAETNVENIMSLGASGAIPGRTVTERRSRRQIALATFQTARDQAAFSSSQSTLKAKADVADAMSQLDIAQETLRTLLGGAVDSTEQNEQSLSRLEVRAPFAGSIESRTFAQNERVSSGDSLFVLANTESLYVAADIRESDWPAVSLTDDTVLKVSVPALGDRVLDATVTYVGREVNQESNSIPLVAKISNAEGLLRPGMFVRVSVPMGGVREALSIKPESVVQHENRQFVFLDLSGGAFQRVDITTGLVSEDWVEVTGGLKSGQRVVHQGAFLLKSELLLEGEE